MDTDAFFEEEEQSLEMDEILEKIVFYCFDEARGKLDAGEDVVPFTVVVEGDQMFVENYPEEDVETCRANAMANVKSASTFASHFAFCYDGFLMADDGQIDAIVVECATREMEQSYIIALVYLPHEDAPIEYEQTPAFVDNGESFFDRATVEKVIASENADTKEEADLLAHLSGGNEEGE